MQKQAPAFKIAILGILMVLGCSCNNPNRKIPAVSQKVISEPKLDTTHYQPYDYSTFEYNLPESNYSYKVKITEIITKVAKKVFSVKADEYSVPTKVDGYFLTVKFSLTNPYNREMLAPLPDYFSISSRNKQWFSSSTTYHRDCQCDIDNSTKVFTDKGLELYEVSEGKCGYDNYCIRYKPNETKNYMVSFTDPIYSGVRELLFFGFNRKWKNPERPSDRDIAFVIDVDKLKIISEVKF